LYAVTSQDCQRIGHGGASALVAGNTLESFDAALEVGVDMIEFDVRATGRELVLAHTALEARWGLRVSLNAALAHLSGPRFRDLGVNIDVKQAGCEPALLEGISRANLLDRALVSSQVPGVLARIRELDPRVRVGISIGGRLPRLVNRWGDWRARTLAGLASGRWDVLMAQHRLIGPALLGDVVDRGGHLYAWTVNERPVIETLRGIGVHGITTSDPRLFGPA
jgi:glycerophosphoryl diester phosphodiesterase